MQGKGIIKALFAILIVVTLYQLLLWFQANRVESAGQSICGDNRGCYSDYLDSVSNVSVFSIPGIKSFTYSDLKSQQIGLGLDLKGGMSATLQVDLQEHLRKVADKQPGDDPMFDLALKNAQKQMANVQQDYLTVFGQEWDKVSNGRSLGEIFSFSAGSDKISLNSTTAEVLDMLREDTKDIVKQTYNMLLQRIDKLGVVQPNLTLDESRDLILAELPGIENPELGKRMLERTAKLEFWKTLTFGEVYNGLQNYDTYLKDKNPSNDSTAVTGPLFKIFSLGGAGNDCVVGTVNKRNVAALQELFEDPEMRQFFPDVNAAFKVATKPYTDQSGKINENQDYQVYAINAGYEGKADMDGDVVSKASVSTRPEDGTGVDVQMRGAGPETWCRITTEANASGRRVAIVLDNQVVSAPGVTNGPICGGTGVTRITGNFSVQEADEFAKILEIGALPAKPRIISHSSVGPTLGKENISRSVNSLIIGFALVLAFMIAYYNGAGIVSILALIANIIFIFGALSSQGAIMTLPGIAGIVLTIGMAVDANVIIYERIREELRVGKSLLVAIQDGFQHSYSAIIDANVTTLLTAFVLQYFGMGPIKGFAVVLIIGVIMSVITAVLLGRLIIDWWTISKGKDLKFSMGWSERMFSNLKIDWLGKRKMAYTFSAIVILAGLVSIFTQGFDLGVDFSGGYNYTVEFGENQNISSSDLKETLKDVFDGKEPIVKTFDNSANRFAITTKYGMGGEVTGVDDVSTHVLGKLHEGINTLVGGKLDLLAFEEGTSPVAKLTTSNIVGPTIANDIRDSSRIATTVALLFIFLYIFIRFRKWQFSLGAVAALFHDVLFTLGIFSLLWKFVPWSMEIDQAFIAAILTVVGYSINDTVVVFDRIREYINTYSGMSKRELFNSAISSTVSRTVITSVTTLFVILMLFLFGSGSIKGFAFALLIGVVIGTYSSIFIATPIVYDATSELEPKETPTEVEVATQA